MEASLSLRQRLADLREAAGTARRGVQLMRALGRVRGLGPGELFGWARDVARGLRGGAAMVHLHALADPLRPAMVSIPVGGPELRLSYGELDRRVQSLAAGLRGLGVGPRARVGVLLHNRHEHLELACTLGMLGAVAVQIGVRLKGPEVAYIVENSGARALVFDGDLAPLVEAALADLGRRSSAPLDRASCVVVDRNGQGADGFRSYESLLETPARTAAAATPGGNGGVMLYTSGTTGRAKGATRTMGAMASAPVVHFLAELPLSRDERHLVVCPLYHAAAPAFAALTLVLGGCNVILEHFDAEAMLRAIERERITSSLVVPTLLARLAELPAEVVRRYDLSSLRLLITTAAPLPTELARVIEDRFGPILYNFYGATETGLVTLAKPGEHTARPGTIGRMIGGNHIRLLDDAGRDVPEGQIGELYVKSGMLISGYHDNRAATEAAMKGGYLSVGDLAYRDEDGYYFLADRKSDMIISGGVNIYPWEIEQRLYAHPAVFDAAVVGVPDAKWGESVAAFVVLRPGQVATEEQLIEHVRAALADFKRPRRIHFVDALPRTPTGKILKRELKQRAAASASA